jgi:hypothetical protein
MFKGTCAKCLCRTNKSLLAGEKYLACFSIGVVVAVYPIIKIKVGKTESYKKRRKTKWKRRKNLRRNGSKDIRERRTRSLYSPR